VKRFFIAYNRQIRTSICDPRSDLGTKVNTATEAGPAQCPYARVQRSRFRRPSIALLAPIAAILLVKGIDAFCTMDREQRASA